MAPKPNPPRPKGDGKSKPPATPQPPATAQSKKPQSDMSDAPPSMAGMRRGREALAAELDATQTTPPVTTEPPANAQPPATPSQHQEQMSGPPSPSRRPHKQRPDARSPASQQPASGAAPPPHAQSDQEPPVMPEPSEVSSTASLTVHFANLVPTPLSDAAAANAQPTVQPATLAQDQAPPDARAASSSPQVFQATTSNTGSSYASMADKLRMAALPGHMAAAIGPLSAKKAAELRVSSAPAAPTAYRHPPGTSDAVRVDPAGPSGPERQPTPQEAADMFLAEQAQRQREAALRKQGKQPKPPQLPPAAPETADEPPPLTEVAEDAMDADDPPPPPMPPPPVPTRFRPNSGQPQRPHPQVSTSILIARQRWLGYIHHRLPPPPPLIWAWGIINPDMIDD